MTSPVERIKHSINSTQLINDILQVINSQTSTGIISPFRRNLLAIKRTTKGKTSLFTVSVIRNAENARPSHAPRSALRRHRHRETTRQPINSLRTKNN